MTAPTTIDMGLRFGGRVLGVHAFINTERDPHTLAKQLQRAVRGPRMDACLSWLEGYRPGHSQHQTVWDAMIAERNLDPLEAPTISPAVTLLAFHLYVNTEADPYQIQKAVVRLARGERLDAAVCWTELFEGSAGQDVWTEIQSVSKKVAADSRSKPYSLAQD